MERVLKVETKIRVVGQGFMAGRLFSLLGIARTSKMNGN